MEAPGGVILRACTPDDLPAVRALRDAHSSDGHIEPGGVFQPTGLVVEDGGRIVAYGTARRTAEGFLFIDHEWRTPRERWRAIQELLAAGGDYLRAHGIGELHLFTHDPAFARRMSRLPFVHKDERHHLWWGLWED